jgi:hypothetical protein
VCAANDALVHTTHRFRADRVRCHCCHAVWRVRRVPGDSFYLKLVAATSGVGDERSIADWYDAMKATVHLAPIHDPAIALPPDEVLYLTSGAVEMYAEESDPLFFPVPESPEATRVDKREVRGKTVRTGRLFMTDRRLVWQGEEASRSFPLSRVNSAYAIMDLGLTLMVELRLYTVHFLEESLLKWLTYIALVAPQVETETGHRITTSHF